MVWLYAWHHRESKGKERNEVEEEEEEGERGNSLSFDEEDLNRKSSGECEGNKIM